MEERIVVNIEFMQCRSIFSAIYRIQRLLEAQHTAPLLSQGQLYNLKHMEQLEHLSLSKSAVCSLGRVGMHRQYEQEGTGRI